MKKKERKKEKARERKKQHSSSGSSIITKSSALRGEMSTDARAFSLAILCFPRSHEARSFMHIMYIKLHRSPKGMGKTDRHLQMCE